MPTGSWSLCLFQMNREGKNKRLQNIWKSYVWSANQPPAGLLAQLVEQCTDIAKVMDSNPVQAWIFAVHKYGFYIFTVKIKKDVNKPVKIWIMTKILR